MPPGRSGPRSGSLAVVDQGASDGEELETALAVGIDPHLGPARIADAGKRPAPNPSATQIGAALLRVGADPVEEEAVRLLDHPNPPASRRRASRRSQRTSDASENRSAMPIAVALSPRTAKSSPASIATWTCSASPRTGSAAARQRRSA